jgi:hypothetical protein
MPQAHRRRRRPGTSGRASLTRTYRPQLLAIKLDSVLGCTPYRAPDLADPGKTVTAQPLNEIMASVTQAAPIALVPLLDPMVLTGGAHCHREYGARRA